MHVVIRVSVLQSSCDNTLLPWIGNAVYHTLKFIMIKKYHDNLRNNVIETQKNTWKLVEMLHKYTKIISLPSTVSALSECKSLLTLHTCVRQGLFKVLDWGHSSDVEHNTFGGSLMPKPSHVWGGSGIVSDISCHIGQCHFQIREVQSDLWKA